MLPLDYLDRFLAARREPFALSDTAQQLTHEALARASMAIAGVLAGRADPARRPVRVAILLERNVHYLAAMFAAWRLGGHFVPLNTRWPPARIAEIVDHCGADVVLCHRAGAYAPCDALYLEDIDLDHPPAVLPRRAAGPDGLAYLIYTSGSTGAPKGVMISNRAYATYIEWTRRFFAPYAANRRLLVTAELTFDITMGDIAFALAFGTSVVVAPDPRNVVKLVQAINSEGIDTLYSVPTTHNILFNFVARKRGVDVDSLRLVISGGEGFAVDLVKLVKRTAERVHFYNVYGPTEATINCFAIRLDDRVAEMEAEGAVPIGRPFDVIEAVIVDENGADVTEEGRLGRLCVGGAQVMLGYHGDPRASAAAFVPDPRDPASPRRLYDTGDLAIKRHDGLVYLMGRSDELVKVKGYRIHPDEVTRALGRLAPVREAATIAAQDGPSARLVAFVTLRAPIDEAAIRAGLAEWLPDYMLPSEVRILDRMPLNNSGKIDKIALGRSVGEAGAST